MEDEADGVLKDIEFGVNRTAGPYRECSRRSHTWRSPLAAWYQFGYPEIRVSKGPFSLASGWNRIL